jgi:ubiquinone/menaquinone biosynthesis C-methylase UbiE
MEPTRISDPQEAASAADSENPHRRVQSQFGPAAASYTTSAVHGDKDALRRVVQLTQPCRHDAALDVATGAGHTALALAPHVASVVAYDLTEQMLAETRRNAAAQGITNVATRQGAAEELPFAYASFDIVTVRHAPHHFADIRRAVREMARVAKPGARVVIVDSMSPEDASLDVQWNHIERLRDPSHVRNYRPSEWRAMLEEARLEITQQETGSASENGGPMDFFAWTARMRTPRATVDELAKMFRNAAPALAAMLRVETAGQAIFFRVPQITIAARKP